MRHPSTKLFNITLLCYRSYTQVQVCFNIWVSLDEWSRMLPPNSQTKAHSARRYPQVRASVSAVDDTSLSISSMFSRRRGSFRFSDSSSTSYVGFISAMCPIWVVLESILFPPISQCLHLSGHCPGYRASIRSSVGYIAEARWRSGGGFRPRCEE